MCQLTAVPNSMHRATAVSLALGRFVFLDFQRDNAARQGMPVQNGITHEEAGDRLAGEVPFLK